MYKRNFFSAALVVATLTLQPVRMESLMKTGDADTNADRDSTSEEAFFKGRKNSQEKNSTSVLGAAEQNQEQTYYEVVIKSITEPRKEQASRECDDEDNCKPSYSGDGDNKNGDNEDALKTTKSSDSNAKYSLTLRKVMSSKKKPSRPIDAFEARDSFNKPSSARNSGNALQAKYEVVSKSVTPIRKEPSNACDDEDDCEPSYSGNEQGNKDDGDTNGKYSLVIKRIHLNKKEVPSPTDTFAADGDSVNGQEPKYEVVSMSVVEQNKLQPNKDCDDEDDCKPSYSGDGHDEKDGGDANVVKTIRTSQSDGGYSLVLKKIMPSKKKLPTTPDTFAVDGTSIEPSTTAKSEELSDTELREVVSKVITSIKKKKPTKECDDKDNCGKSYSVNEEGNNDDDNTNGKYSLVIKKIHPTKEKPPKDSFTIDDESDPSSNSRNSPLVPYYEDVSISVVEKSKTRPTKECDDEDDCEPSYSGSESGDDDEDHENTDAGYSLVIKWLPPPNKGNPSLRDCDGDDCDPSYRAGKNDNDRENDWYEVSSSIEPIPGSSKVDRGYSPPQHQPKDKPLFLRSFRVLPPLGKKAEEYFEVDMKIKPMSDTGLLLYTGEKKQTMGDFISLSLRKGYVELSFNCGSGTVRIRSIKPVVMNKWNEVGFYRSERLGRLLVNSDDPAIGLSPGPHTLMSLNQNLFIGGVSNVLKSEVDMNLGFSTGFNGYIQNLRVNGIIQNLEAADHKGKSKIEACSVNPCKNGGKCLMDHANYSCSCPIYYRGKNCEQEIDLRPVNFNNKSYIHFNKSALLQILNRPNSAVSFALKTARSNGLIIWEVQKSNDQLQKYFAISLENGFISISYDAGFGKHSLRSIVAVNNGNWHKIAIERTQRSSFLVIDGMHRMEFKALISSYPLELNVDLYVGGAPDIVQETHSMYRSGFSGCLKRFLINNQYLDFVKDAVSSENIENCNDN